MAQPGSALAWGASGRWFESSPPDLSRGTTGFPFFFRDVAQPGSVLRSGRRGRWFESSHPDSKKPVFFTGFCHFSDPPTTFIFAP